MIEVIISNMKLNITQIRELLKERNYLTDKSIDVSEIKTGKKYQFTCEKYLNTSCIYKEGMIYYLTVLNKGKEAYLWTEIFLQEK